MVDEKVKKVSRRTPASHSLLLSKQSGAFLLVLAFDHMHLTVLNEPAQLRAEEPPRIPDEPGKSVFYQPFWRKSRSLASLGATLS